MNTNFIGSDAANARHPTEAFSTPSRFHQPCLGCREFPASFALIEPGEPLPAVDPALRGERDLGWMLLDIDFSAGNASRFFRALMRDGVIEVPAMAAAGTAA